MFSRWESNKVDCLMVLGRAHRNLNQNELACDVYQAIIKIDQRNTKAPTALAGIYNAIGMTDEATRLRQTVKEIKAAQASSRRGTASRRQKRKRNKNKKGRPGRSGAVAVDGAGGGGGGRGGGGGGGKARSRRGKPVARVKREKLPPAFVKLAIAAADHFDALMAEGDTAGALASVLPMLRVAYREDPCLEQIHQHGSGLSSDHYDCPVIQAAAAWEEAAAFGRNAAHVSTAIGRERFLRSSFEAAKALFMHSPSTTDSVHLSFRLLETGYPSEADKPLERAITNFALGIVGVQVCACVVCLVCA